ncbi:hypothetical protein JCM8547_008970 [Rhodosporidiobolus lusitaniae]
MSHPAVDLSDLDPFSPSLSSSSSLFPTPSSSHSAASSSFARPISKDDLTTRSLTPGAGGDPLGGLLGGISLTSSGSGSGSVSPGRPGTGSLPPPPGVAVQQKQAQRSAHILADLAREPFTAEPSSSSSSIPSSTSASRPHASQHPPFSPPRRLSTLMSSSPPSSSSTFPSFAPGSPPESSSILSDPFHPPHLPNGSAQRRMREASGDFSMSPSSATVGGGGGEGTWAGLEEALAGSVLPSSSSREKEKEKEAIGHDGDASWGDFVEAPPTPPTPRRKQRDPAPPSQPSSSASLPPPVPLARTARTSPSPSRSTLTPSASSSSSSASAGRAKTFPDPSTLQPRSRPAPSPGGGAFDPAAQPIKLVGVRPGVQRVLDEDVAEGLRPSLPPRLRLSPRWTLLYSLDQHGISLSTLFSQLEKGLKDRDGGFVMVIKTERGEVLGAYVSEALKKPGREERVERWVGDGTCFLFSTSPFPPSDPRLGLTVRPFPPTFRNTYFAHASPQLDFLAFGGGNDGVFGLWIDGQMERGWTGRSETYGNEVLVRGRRGDGEGEGGDGKGKFEVVGLECWAVGT